MTNLIKPCPPGVDPKEWLPIDGMTKGERREMIRRVACDWWKSLTPEDRDRWDRELEEEMTTPAGRQ